MKPIVSFTPSLFIGAVSQAIYAEADKTIVACQMHVDLLRQLPQTPEVLNQIELLQAEVSYAEHWRDALTQAVQRNNGKLRKVNA